MCWLLGFTFTTFGINFLVTDYKGHSESNVHPFLYLNARYDIELKQNTKCNAECVPCFCTSSIFVVSLSFDTLPPVVNKFFWPVTLELFWLFSKPISDGGLNFITCEMISLEMFLKSFKQPVVRQCQICALGRVWNDFKYNALYSSWSCNTSVECGLIMLKKQFCPLNVTNSLFPPL